MVLQAKEHPTIPLGTGDLMGDRRKGFVGSPQIFEVVGPYRYTVRDALPLSDQLGACNWTVHWPRLSFGRALVIVLLRHGTEPFEGFAAEASVSQFLDPVGKPALKKTAVVLGWLALKKFPPFCL